MNRRVRLAAVVCGLLAFGLRLFSMFRVEPWSWRLESGVMMFGIWVLSLVLSLTIPVGLFAAMAFRWRSRPAELGVDRERRQFVVSSLVHLNAAYCILFMWMAGGALMVERVPGQEARRIADLPGALLLSLLAVALFTAVGVWLLFVPLVRVRMSAEFLRVRRLVISDLVAWDQIVAVEPVRSGLRIHRAGLAKPLGVPSAFLAVDAGFLAGVINRYARQAQARAAIGTREELDRLGLEQMTVL